MWVIVAAIRMAHAEIGPWPWYVTGLMVVTCTVRLAQIVFREESIRMAAAGFTLVILDKCWIGYCVFWHTYEVDLLNPIWQHCK